MYNGFKEDIQKFNNMYELPFTDIPTNLGIEKFEAMVDIIEEEVQEGDDI